MSDFTLVDPKGWEYDLHSVYSAYIGYFQLHSIPWYDRSWGHLFSSFEEFLAFSWPVITVTDAWTGKPHIVTRLTSIGAFLKMIKTRFGETLQQAPNILQVTPFESSTRHLRHISDYASYKKLHSTLPAAVLSALKARIKAGEPKAIRELWEKRDKTFLAIDFEWSERNEKSCLEWGYAAVRCGHLDALGHWPPNPDSNYRKGHYIIGEYVDKVFNKHCPTHPWHYAFGDSQIAPKSKLPEIIQAVISSLASPDSETTANTLVLVAHGIGGDLARLEEMKIKLPHNMLVIDTATYERVMHTSGLRGIMLDPRTNAPRVPGSTLSLENLLRSFTTNPLHSPARTPSPHSPHPPPSPTHPQTPQVNVPTSTSTPTLVPPPIVLPNVMMHNAGNDAFLALFALQMLLEPANTPVPTVKKGWIGRPSHPHANGGNMGVPGTPPGVPRARSMVIPAAVAMVPVPVPVPTGYGMMPPVPVSPLLQPSGSPGGMGMVGYGSGWDLAAEFGQMRVGQGGGEDMGTGSRGRRAPGRSGAGGGGGGGYFNGVSVNSRR